jgi:hypothetical protein
VQNAYNRLRFFDESVKYHSPKDVKTESSLKNEYRPILCIAFPRAVLTRIRTTDAVTPSK